MHLKSIRMYGTEEGPSWTENPNIVIAEGTHPKASASAFRLLDPDLTGLDQTPSGHVRAPSSKYFITSAIHGQLPGGSIPA